MEEILFKSEKKMSKTEIANYLRKVADKLESGEPIRLSDGENSVELEPSDQPEFEVKAEKEGEEYSIELEIEWEPGESKNLTID